MEVALPNLPSDIISFQILTRLLAKSLMRFKCVCKSWSSSLFLDPFFVKAYQNMHNSLSNNHRTTHLLLSNREGQRIMFSMQFNQELGFTNSPTRPAIDLLSHNSQITSSNGLICLYNNDAAVPVGIFNPCTGEFTTLPVSQYASKSSSDSGWTVLYRVQSSYKRGQGFPCGCASYFRDNN
ncbi:F-box protein At5g62510-like [Rosa rugosa]|uniref:F-box protein At5g62510-like n=1 Tax=Rosa rugosa TaxID=74645 RepID=UPI002B417819|nr:F-box protein At5g62510-like [Rosa rugosa]